MSGEHKLSNLVPRLLSLAARLEGEGQYNVAKLSRTASETLLRCAAYQRVPPKSRREIASELDEIIKELEAFEVNPDLMDALQRGALAIQDGRLTMYEETPDPYVCRTCGFIEFNRPDGDCPICKARSGTFMHFPAVYWLEAMDPYEAMTCLRETPGKVDQLLRGLSEEDMRYEPREGEWSIHNAISHLRDAQGVLDFRVNLLLEEDFPLIESQAVFEWATTEGDRSPSTGEIFQMYSSSRQRTLQGLEGIRLEDWWRKGRHEEFGVVTIKAQVSYFATHELTHLPQIEKLRDHIVALQ